MGAFLHAVFDFQLNSLLGKREELEQQAPADEQQDDNQREHKHHPLTEAQAEVQSFGIVQVFQRDSVRWCTDRCSHTAEVGSNGNRHSKRDTALALGRQLAEHRRQECQHHSGCGGVRHEHREQSRNQQESQQHHLTPRAERLQQHLCQLRVQSGLRGGNSQHETADEQHDNGVGKRRHHSLIRQQRTHLVLNDHRRDTAVRTEQKHQHDDRYRRSPRRHDRHDPHQRGEGENGDDALLDDRQSVDAEPFSRCIPQQQSNDSDNDGLRGLLEGSAWMKAAPHSHLMVSFYKLITFVNMKHTTLYK